MLCAMRVKSPFSHSAVFGFTRAPSSDSRLAVIYPIRRRAARVRVVGARRSSRPDDRRHARVAVVLLARVLAEHVEQLARDHRCEQIDLVGHSEGGLIGWYYVQKLDGAVPHPFAAMV